MHDSLTNVFCVIFGYLGILTIFGLCDLRFWGSVRSNRHKKFKCEGILNKFSSQYAGCFRVLGYVQGDPQKRVPEQNAIN